MRRAVDIGLELIQGVAALGSAGGAGGDLRLRAQRRERRAQLMSGVGRETPLARQHLGMARQQPVQRHSQRVRLDGHFRRVDRRQIISAASRQVGRDTPHRAKGALGHEGD